MHGGVSGVVQFFLKIFVTLLMLLFGFEIPKACEGVPSEILNPINTVSNKSEYAERANKLVADFRENFRQFENDVSKKVLKATP